MSITQEEKQLLVQLQCEKADSFLQQADFLYKNKMWDITANRYYYAMFHLVQALFITNGISSHTHAGMINMFHLHFVKSQKVPKELGILLSRMEQMRERADYNCSYDVTEKEIIEIKPFVITFFEKVKSLIDIQQDNGNKTETYL